MGWKGGLLVAAGLGAALVSGTGVAHADSTGTGSSPGRPNSSQSVGQSRPSAVHTLKKPTPPRPSAPRSELVMLAASTVARRDPIGVAGHPRRPTAPPPPVPAVVASTIRFFGELHDYLTGAPDPRPAPGETTSTPYGEIGKWMLARTGKLADWPSHPFKTLYQPINVIIVDSTSTTPAESAQRVNAAMTAAGFPAQPIHSTGYQGVIDGVAYGQQPTGPQQAFANAHWLLPNDHGRVFGPAPAPDGVGYVWTASFSREEAGLYYLIPTHLYVSFNRARTRLRARLLAAGATDLGLVDLGNELTGRTTTTGDHDGYAVVIKLN